MLRSGDPRTQRGLPPAILRSMLTILCSKVAEAREGITRTLSIRTDNRILAFILGL